MKGTIMVIVMVVIMIMIMIMNVLIEFECSLIRDGVWKTGRPPLPPFLLARFSMLCRTIERKKERGKGKRKGKGKKSKRALIAHTCTVSGIVGERQGERGRE